MKTKTSSTYWWISLLKGVLLIVFGIWMLKAPKESFIALNFIFGLIILLSGMLEIVISINNRNNLKEWGWHLFAGIIDSLIGIFLMANPKFILLLITLFVSFWLILRGILFIREAIQLKNLKGKNWGWLLALGILLILLSIALIWHPEIVGLTIVFWTALAFISLGIFRVILAFKIQKSTD